jgi:hypothetical protein
LFKVISKKKSGFANSTLKAAFDKKIKLAMVGSIALGTATLAIIQRWQNKLINKPSSEPQELLEKYGSDTSAQMSDANFRSNLLAAQYNPINGIIDVNKNYFHDPIGKKRLEKLIKHELQHARQFEMIAALDNGLEKLNYSIINLSANYMKRNPVALFQIQKVIADVKKDTVGKYNNTKIYVSGAEVDFKNYIKALDMLINEDEVDIKELPMIIDAEHYKKAIAKRGKLSEAEKKKAEEYYQAHLHYPALTGFNLINPFSGYRSNLLEKEANKAAKSKTGKINE